MMKKLLLIHGPNLNFLGRRDPEKYGKSTLSDLEMLVANEANQYGYEIIPYQSNHEGDLIDIIQVEAQNCAGIIINPGAFTHYSYALHDALLDTKLPIIEVHLSNIKERESWRQHSVIAPVCIKSIYGLKEEGYREAIKVLVEHINNDDQS